MAPPAPGLAQSPPPGRPPAHSPSTLRARAGQGRGRRWTGAPRPRGGLRARGVGETRHLCGPGGARCEGLAGPGSGSAAAAAPQTSHDVWSRGLHS